MRKKGSRELLRRVEEGELADGAAFHLLWERVEKVLEACDDDLMDGYAMAQKVIRLLNGEEK